MDKFIDLSSLVSHDKIEVIKWAENNNDNLITDTIVRGKSIKYFTPTQRLLWIAVGIEHIEPELLDFIDSLEPNSIFYDVGASNGPYSMYAAVNGMLVVAFEPEAQNFSLLEMNHFLNRDVIEKSIISLNVAISNEDKLGKIFCAKYEVGGHMKILDRPKKVLESALFEPAHVQYVQKYSLDSLISRFGLPPPHAIKIDVDGSEMDVLVGAKNTLCKKSLTKIFVEIEERLETNIFGYLQGFGFKLKHKTQVQRYSGLFNCIFEKTNTK